MRTHHPRKGQGCAAPALVASAVTMGGNASHHTEREAVDFSTSLLWFHLGRSPPTVHASGEVRPDSALFFV